MNTFKKMIRINPYTQILGSVSQREAADFFKKVQQHGGVQIGLGHMGKNMVVAGQRAGIPFALQELNPEVLRQAEREIPSLQDKAVKVRALPGLDRARIFLYQPTETINNPVTYDYGDKMFLLEAIRENKELKIKVLGGALKTAQIKAIVGFNSSSLDFDGMAEALPHPENVVGTHFFDPAHINDLFEIYNGELITSPETLAFAYNYAKAMGKTPVVAWNNKLRSFANAIICASINEAAKMVHEGAASPDVADEVFMEVFYGKQKDIVLPDIVKTFREKIPKVGWFKDEASRYKAIKSIDRQIQNILSSRNSLKHANKLKELYKQKEEILKVVQDRLNQKTVYTSVVKNYGEQVGSMWEPPQGIQTIEDNAIAQLKAVNEYLSQITKPEDYQKSFEITPYEYPRPNTKPVNDRKYIADRLRGAYIGVVLKIIKEGIATPHDTEVTAMAGFRYNIGAVTMAKQMGQEETDRVLTLVNEHVDQSKYTGIVKPGEFNLSELDEDATSGIQTYVQGDVGHIVMGRYHVQQLNIMMNSLHPDMMNAMIRALIKLNNDPNVNAIIIESQGSNNGKGVFCSGADLNYIEENNWDTTTMTNYTALGKDLMNRIVTSKKTITGIIDGTATGGGLELACAIARQGYVFVTTRASAAFPECNLGLFPALDGVKNFLALVGDRAALPFIAGSKGLFPKLKLIWMSDQMAMDLGFANNSVRIPTMDLPGFMADLVEGKAKGKIIREVEVGQEVQGRIIYTRKNPDGKEVHIVEQEEYIDIRKNPNKADVYDKPLSEYPAETVYKLGMKEDKNGNVVFNRRWRWTTRFPAKVAEELIMNSHDPNYEKDHYSSITSERIINSARKTFNFYIKPQLFLAQSKSALLTLGALQQSAIGLGKYVLSPAFKVTKTVVGSVLKYGIGLPLYLGTRVAKDVLNHYMGPVVYEINPKETPTTGKENGK